MLHLWLGPMTLAVYIPAPEGTPKAKKCREQVLSYLEGTIAAINRATEGKGHPHLALHTSFLYGNHDSPTIHCTLSEDSTGLEPSWTDMNSWKKQFGTKPYIDIYDAEYPVGALRQLALTMVRGRTPAAHMHFMWHVADSSGAHGAELDQV
jgi:hypothetical protein